MDPVGEEAQIIVEPTTTLSGAVFIEETARRKDLNGGGRRGLDDEVGDELRWRKRWGKWRGSFSAGWGS